MGTPCLGHPLRLAGGGAAAGGGADLSSLETKIRKNTHKGEKNSKERNCCFRVWHPSLHAASAGAEGAARGPQPGAAAGGSGERSTGAASGGRAVARGAVGPVAREPAVPARHPRVPLLRGTPCPQASPCPQAPLLEPPRIQELRSLGFWGRCDGHARDLTRRIPRSEPSSPGTARRTQHSAGAHPAVEPPQVFSIRRVPASLQPSNQPPKPVFAPQLPTRNIIP